MSCVELYHNQKISMGPGLFIIVMGVQIISMCWDTELDSYAAAIVHRAIRHKVMLGQVLLKRTPIFSFFCHLEILSNLQ